MSETLSNLIKHVTRNTACDAAHGIDAALD
jgi:hypothetical protein